MRRLQWRGAVAALVVLAGHEAAAGEPAEKGPGQRRSSTEVAEAYARAASYVPWQVPTWLQQDETYAARWSPDGRQFRFMRAGPVERGGDAASGRRLKLEEMVGDARDGRLRPSPVAGPTPGAQPTTLDPQGRVGIGLEGFNLWAVDSKSGSRTPLTRDGTEENSYSALYEFGVLLEVERKALGGPMRAAQGAWSPDGRYFASFRYDQRAVGRTLYWFAVTDKGYGARPQYVEQRGAFPGEPNAFAELVIVDMRSREARTIQAARFETFLDPFTAGLVQWSADGKSLYFLEEGRGLRSVSVQRIDAESGRVETLYREQSRTYLMLSGSRYPAIWSVLRDGRRMLWFSEQDGWGNLYVVDLRAGKIAHAVTTGEGVVTRLLRVDQASGWVYFLAVGRDRRIDPYFKQLWRARLDGTATEQLTPEDADHFVSMPARGAAFLDVQSAGVASPPRTLLRSMNGKVLATVAATDAAPLQARRWRGPERVRVRSADDRYDVYVTVFRPSDYDAKLRYPVLDYVYGLSSLALTPRSFPLGRGAELSDSYWHAQATAELGFIVVKLDAPGTPLRGHAFARESYGEGHVGAMLEHHVAALRQLAQRDPSMDLDRVGIFGSSGGGYTSTRAMLLHPDFFKAAVSFSSSHDLLRLYGPEWGERYIVPFETHRALYERLSNTTYADRLRGPLLLAHGEADTEVTILMDQQFAHALIAANRDFDMLYIPNAEHDLDSNAYAVRKRWDFFIRHLRGEQPPPGFRLPEPSGIH